MIQCVNIIYNITILILAYRFRSADDCKFKEFSLGKIYCNIFYVIYTNLTIILLIKSR